MLTALHVKNYAIIRESEIYFDKKLNIITGETGAGKSILMGALGLILGDRADTKVLMNVEEKCIVEGIFKIKAYQLNAYFEDEGLDYDDTCIIRREISSSGKSRAFINDTPVTLNQLKDLGTKLVDIVSQNQTLQLNDESFQLSILDAIAENSVEKRNYQQVYHLWKEASRILVDLKQREIQARKDEDYLKFVLNELTEAKPLEEEQLELERKLDVLSHAELIKQSSINAFDVIEGNENSIIQQLNLSRQMMLSGAKFHPELEALIQRLSSTIIELKDISAELETIGEQTEANPEVLLQVESRLQLLFNLHKKHQVLNNKELIAWMHKLEADLSKIGSLQDEILETEKSIHSFEEQLNNLAQKLSEKRTSASPKIEQEIQKLLVQVQMPDAQLKVENKIDQSTFHANGIDHISFLFSANKGSTFQPLNKVASGGELSRLMLCIKSLINDKVALPTIVFDEIDTGISGEAALKVSQVMKKHADKHQVIAITHLPQIAGKADAHFYIYKSSDKHTTTTHIKSLNESERVEEIARMLHGENPSAKVIEAAKELMHS
jgi:DNA repair protein RecN (Recombination protein N)